MARISSEPLRVEALFLCRNVTKDDGRFVIEDVFNSTRPGKQHSFKLFALLSGAPGDYGLAVDVVAESGEHWLTRRAEPFQHAEHTLSYYSVGFDAPTIGDPGRIEFRLLCDDKPIGSTTLTVVPK